jgi:hypothetical protein
MKLQNTVTFDIATDIASKYNLSKKHDRSNGSG